MGQNAHFMLLCETAEQVQGKCRPKECLDIDDSLCISHVVLLCNHGAFLVYYHHSVCESHATSQQTVQTVQVDVIEKSIEDQLE